MKLRILKVDEVSPNPLQPRESFDREKLKELADTVSDMGVLQPIVVRPKGSRYEIIAGERRWKASQIAGKKEIPAIVKDVPDEGVMVESLIENVHREDLKPLEQAKAILEVFKAQETFLFKKGFISTGFVTDELPNKIAAIGAKVKVRKRVKVGERSGVHSINDLKEEEKLLEKIVKRIGLTPARIYEALTLLKLPKFIQEEATEKGVGKFQLARIAAIEDEETQEKVFRKVADEDLSYEKTAKLVSTVKKSPDHIKEALLKEEPSITPELAEEILTVEREEEQAEIIRKIETEGLTPEKTKKLIEITQRAPERVKRAILGGEIEIERVEPLIEVGITEEKAENLVQELKIEKAEEEEWREIALDKDIAVLKGDLKAKGIVVEKSVDEKRVNRFRQLYDQIRFLTPADFLQIKHKKFRQQAIKYLTKMEENCHNLRIALEKL